MRNRLRGAARLAIDATLGLTDLVEAVHERIVRLPGAAARDGRTRGITGLVYKTIRGVTHVVSGSVDALLAALVSELDDRSPLPEREALVAALNGVLGDHLAATANPLATPMSWRRAGRELPAEPAALQAAWAAAPPPSLIVVTLHGLCMNEASWRRDGSEPVEALAAALGGSAVHLRYNTGLHVSCNGQALAARLEALVGAAPREAAQGPQEPQGPQLVLLGHSMGGLLARSALHQGTLAGQRWPARVRAVVFLGTPHHGAPLERAGHWATTLLAATPYAAPFARLGRLRSAGITDLRHGNLLREDWAGSDRFADATDRRYPLPLPAAAACFTVAASLGAHAGAASGRLLGDGLVPVASALGQHRSPARALAFPEAHRFVAHGMGHLELTTRPEVYAQLLAWLGPVVRG